MADHCLGGDIALAGTQHLVDGRLPKPWDEKNMREQQLVATYIRERLERLGIHPEEQGPYSAFAVELAHLRSDFRFELSDTRHLGDLLDLLHPTPAVCGRLRASQRGGLSLYFGA